MESPRDNDYIEYCEMRRHVIAALAAELRADAATVEARDEDAIAYSNANYVAARVLDLEVEMIDETLKKERAKPEDPQPVLAVEGEATLQ